MERKTTSTGEFEEAIRNFTKISLKVDSMINSGSAEAHKLKNKSIEDRQEAIANEASKRLKSFEAQQKGLSGKESLRMVVMEEVKSQFDKGVEEEKVKLRSAIYENEENQNKSVNTDSSEDESENESDESTDDESTESSHTTDEDSSEGEKDEDSSGEESGDGETDDDDKTEADEVIETSKK